VTVAVDSLSLRETRTRLIRAGGWRLCAVLRRVSDSCASNSRPSRELPASLSVVSVRMHRKLGVTSRPAVSPSVVFCSEFVGGIHVRYASVTAVVKAVV